MFALLLLVPGLASADPGMHPTAVLPPRWAYDEVWMGGAWETGEPGGTSDVGALWIEPVEFDLHIRNVSDGPDLLGSEVEHRLRLSRDQSGRTLVDELSLQGRFVGLTIRPAMGDLFDLSVIGGRWDQHVYGLALPWTHLQVFVPVHLVAVGFSDTDADSDSALRYYAAAGAGIGADWLFRVAGPVGVRVRAEGAADTMHRLRGEERDQVRHEVWTRVEGDLVLVDDTMPFTFGAWGEARTQWEPRDAPTGVDRQVIAGGLRFGLRLFRGSVFPGGSDGGDIGTAGNPGNERAVVRQEKRHAKGNTRNEKRLDAEPEDPILEEPAPPYPTPEEHEAGNTANGG